MFTRIDDRFDVYVASFGESTGRILVFRTSQLDDYWRRVDGAQILLVGRKIEHEMKRLLNEYGRPSLSDRIPGGISGRAHPALRKHLGLS